MNLQHLYLGISGDEPVCHECTTMPGSYAGHTVMGPVKFIEWLELHLGLSGIFPTAIERAISLKSLITNSKQQSFFFSKSFQADPLGVAKRLLTLWDSWTASGWDMKASKKLPPRMATLAALKDWFEQCGSGVPDRAKLVLQQLPSSSLLPVNIHLIDPPEQFPYVLQQLLTKLGDAVIPGYQNIKAGAAEGTDLWKLQNLLNGKKVSEPLCNDHSLQIIFFDNDIAEANAIYSLQDALDWNPVLINRDNSLLNGLHVSQNHPVSRWQTMTGNGQVSQLFFLATALFRRPVNTSQVIAFLSAPLTPVPKTLATSLARAFSDRPGFGNEDWNKAIDKYFASLAGEENENAIKKRMDFWLQNKLTLVEPGFSVSLLEEIYNQLGQWASQAIHQSYYSIYIDQLVNLSSLCTQLAETLKDEGDVIAFSKLERLQAELFAETPTVIAEAESGSADSFLSPPAIWSPCEQLVWMSAARFDPADCVTRYWYQEEKIFFEQQGLPLHDENHAAAGYIFGLKRMILSVTDRLVITVPSIVNGAVTAKPYCLDEWDKMISLKPVILEPGLLLEKAPWGEQTKLLKEHAPIILPKPVTYFSVPKEHFRRETESYSAIEKMIQHPFEWYMEYRLKLRYSDGIAVPNSNIMKGIIADRVAQEIFTEENRKAKWWRSEKSFLEKVNEVGAQVLVEEGLPFLEKHTKRMLMEYLATMERSLVNLKNFVDSNKLNITATQYTLSGKIDGTPFIGYIDLLLKSGDRNVVVDLKWAGSSRTYRDKIKTGNDLQLVLYSTIIEGGAASAYFLLNDGNAYMRNETGNQGLVNVQYEDAAEGIDTNEVYRRALNGVQYRRKELAEGRVEAGYDHPIEVLNYFRDTAELGLYALKENFKKKQTPFSDDLDLFYGKII